MADEALLANIRAIKGKTVELSGPSAIAYSRLKAIRETLTELEKEEAEIKRLLQSEMIDSEIATIEGKPVLTWKEATSNRLDTAELKRLRPDIYESYTKESVSRRFLVK